MIYIHRYLAVLIKNAHITEDDPVYENFKSCKRTYYLTLYVNLHCSFTVILNKMQCKMTFFQSYITYDQI